MMSRRFASARRLAWSLAAAAGVLALSSPARAQQANDEEYTKKIKEYLEDPRITTELVNHLGRNAGILEVLLDLLRVLFVVGLLGAGGRRKGEHAGGGREGPGEPSGRGKPAGHHASLR